MKAAPCAALGTLSTLIVLGLTSRATADFFAYEISQEEDSAAVTPLVGTEDVVDFYQYNSPDGASSNTVPALETPDTSLLFLYVEEGTGTLSLVMIHDQPNDGDGGSVTFEFSGVPVGTDFVVRDEPVGLEGVLPVSTWNWLPCCTDGGALSGSLNQEFCITIDPTFTSGISEWVFLSGDLSDPEPLLLDMTRSITICCTFVIEPEIDIKPGDDTNCVNPGSRGVIPVAIFSEESFDATQIDPGSISLEGAGVAVRGNGNRLQSLETDVDGDGLLDLLVHVETQGLDSGQVETGVACIIGETFDGQPIFGCDSICIVPDLP